jgi:alkanesulfonate monooxygenase SsuD/methylene tetrahydromethanopterin reductase-like flavin-dependent oxidoreductase (luciferase family)
MRPFATGSISLRLYPHDDLDPVGVVRELCAQAHLALGGGFHGVMTSEHHGGVGGYLPNPLQLAGFALEDSDAGWAAPCPLLLPLRPTALVVEEIAWLEARHPGRVGLGVAAGAMPRDFAAVGLDVNQGAERFKAELPRVVNMLQGRDLAELAGDRALKRCAEYPVPVLAAAVSVAAARRAAHVGAGILTEGMSTPNRLAELCAAFDQAGGTMPKVIIRRVWLGEPLAELVAQQRQFYQSGRGTRGTPQDDQTITTTDPLELAERLLEIMTITSADAINLRVHLPGIAPAAVRDQIEQLNAHTLPRLKKLLGERVSTPTIDP